MINMALKANQRSLIIAVAACLVVGAGAFAGGMAYGRSGSTAAGARLAANGAAFDRGNGQGFTRNGAAGSRTGGRMFGGNVVGEILKIDSQSLTVKLPDGGSRLVFLTDKTTVLKTEAAAITDLTQGTTVRVMGSANQDGSVMAQNIQIVPAGLSQPAPQPPEAAPVK